jgi:hypothetical protein
MVTSEAPLWTCWGDRPGCRRWEIPACAGMTGRTGMTAIAERAGRAKAKRHPRAGGDLPDRESPISQAPFFHPAQLFLVARRFRFLVIAEDVHRFQCTIGIADLGDIEQPVALVDDGQVGSADRNAADFTDDPDLGTAERVSDDAKPGAGLDQGAEADRIAQQPAGGCADPGARLGDDLGFRWQACRPFVLRFWAGVACRDSASR